MEKMDNKKLKELTDKLPAFHTTKEAHQFLDDLDKRTIEKEPSLRYEQSGKIFQIVGYIVTRSSRKGTSTTLLSVCVDHTPKSKYSGKDIRAMERKNGVGRPCATA